MTSAGLANWLWAVKHPGQGVAGSIPGNDETNRVAPIDERNRTVRDLLGLIVSRSDSGGIWVSDSCDMAIYDTGRASCWEVTPYKHLLVTEVSDRIYSHVRRWRHELEMRKP